MNPLQASDSVHGLWGIGRQAGNRKKGDGRAFRRALLGQEAGAEAGGGADTGGGAEAEGPAPTALQPGPQEGRKNPGGGRHVDVLA
ncbi:MAG: hypothetical protein Fur0037_14100 [Planctomycetota bacterium]